MPRGQKAEDETYPSAIEAMEDETAREKRTERGEEVEREAIRAHGAETPRDVSPTIADEARPGLAPLLRAATEGAPEGVKPIESDPTLLADVQDPYHERVPQAVPMVWTMNAYGDLVQMPV